MGGTASGERCQDPGARWFGPQGPAIWGGARPEAGQRRLQGGEKNRDRGTAAAAAHLPGLLASPSRTCSSAQSASECSRQSWRKRAWSLAHALEQRQQRNGLLALVPALKPARQHPDLVAKHHGWGRPSVYKAPGGAPARPPAPKFGGAAARGRRRRVPVQGGSTARTLQSTASAPASLVWFQLRSGGFWLISPEIDDRQ